MYPNSIVSFNIFASTMLGKLFVEDGEKYCNYDDDAGKEFVEDLIAGDILFVGHKWFGLPDFDSLNIMVAERLGIKAIGGSLPEPDQIIKFAA